MSAAVSKAMSRPRLSFPTQVDGAHEPVGVQCMMGVLCTPAGLREGE